MARARIEPFAPGLNVESSEPSAFRRPRRLRVVVPVPPPSAVKVPPTRIFAVCLNGEGTDGFCSRLD